MRVAGYEHGVVGNGSVDYNSLTCVMHLCLECYWGTSQLLGNQCLTMHTYKSLHRLSTDFARPTRHLHTYGVAF